MPPALPVAFERKMFSLCRHWYGHTTWVLWSFTHMFDISSTNQHTFFFFFTLLRMFNSVWDGIGQLWLCCLIWCVSSAGSVLPHSVALTLNWLHTAGNEREGVCLMCGTVWVRSGLKARLIGVSKRDKHTGLFDLLGRQGVNIRTPSCILSHTHTHTQFLLLYATKIHCNIKIAVI